MATWADEVTAMKKNALIRKALDAVVLLAPPDTALPTTITDATGSGLVLPAAFLPLGHHSEDGLTFAREVETSDITSHGAVEPTRSDIRRITSTLAVTAQETNKQTIEASLGISLGATLPASGELTVDEPTRPKAVYYRLLALSVDDSDDGEIYMARIFARAKVTELGEQTWSDGDDAMVRALTFQAFQDAEEGVSVRHLFGGPGWKAGAVDAGFTVGA